MDSKVTVKSRKSVGKSFETWRKSDDNKLVRVGNRLTTTIAEFFGKHLTSVDTELDTSAEFG
jgi:hypothetical protein